METDNKIVDCEKALGGVLENQEITVLQHPEGPKYKGTVRGSEKSSYDFGRVLGNGSFGIVCEGKSLVTGEVVAIKKVLQDARYKNRELDIMKELHHPHIVELKDYFYTESNEKDGGIYLNLVMEYVPQTVYKILKSFVRYGKPVPLSLIKTYSYQMFRSLGYLHSLGICHRDIKPQNLLVDPQTHILKLCDFGSAKRLAAGESSVAYICSRFYRAPELMLGATEYTTTIDIWSVGCVLGELLLGRPLFAGQTSVDQLVKIISILGTPTKQQMAAMNPSYTDFRFPDVKQKDWRKIFGKSVPDSAIDLLSSFLKFEPNERLQLLKALSHPFFDDLRDPNSRMEDGSRYPNTFKMTESELKELSEATFKAALPEWSWTQGLFGALEEAYPSSEIKKEAP